MIDQSPALYQEIFSSEWREAVPLMWGTVGVVGILSLSAIVTGQPWMTEAIIKPAFFITVGVAMLAVSIRTLKSNGEVRVTSKGITIIQEQKERFFAKEEITSITKRVLNKTRHGGRYVLEGEQRFLGKRTPCEVLPYHVPLSPFTHPEGILMHTTAERVETRFFQSGPKPIFIPTKTPDKLLSALNKMKG